MLVSNERFIHFSLSVCDGERVCTATDIVFLCPIHTLGEYFVVFDLARLVTIQFRVVQSADP